MPRDAAHSLGLEIVHRSAQDLAADFFSWRNARSDGLRWEEAGIDHLQRLEYFLGAKLFQFHTSQALDHFTDNDEIEVAVAEDGAGWLGKCLGTNPVEGTLEIEPIGLLAQ